MNVTKYITNVKGLEAYDAAVVKASKNIGKVARVRDGWYLVVINGELVEITRREDADSLNGWWMCCEVNRKWYGDAMPTLKEIKISLEIE